MYHLWLPIFCLKMFGKGEPIIFLGEWFHYQTALTVNKILLFYNLNPLFYICLIILYATSLQVNWKKKDNYDFSCISSFLKLCISSYLSMNLVPLSFIFHNHPSCLFLNCYGIFVWILFFFKSMVVRASLRIGSDQYAVQMNSYSPWFGNDISIPASNCICCWFSLQLITIN